MNHFKKQFLLVLFILSAGLFTASSASAQTWSTVFSNALNPCMNGDVYVNPGQSGQCKCNSNYTYGTAKDANCTMGGFVAGCWNPNNGTCNTCGQGGTITLGNVSCFNNGQGNQGGNDPGIVGVSCTVPAGGTYGSSSSCVSSGTASGGFSTN